MAWGSGCGDGVKVGVWRVFPPMARGLESSARGLEWTARGLEVLAFVTRACVVGFLPLSGSEPEGMRKWRNRQTRWIQVPVPERAWGFNSPLAHRGNGRHRNGDAALLLFPRVADV